MAEDISAEEQRQIDAAIALSLEQASDGYSDIRATAAQRSKNPIIIDDDSSESEGAVLSDAALHRHNTNQSTSISSGKKHDEETASIDSSATEQSIELVPTANNGKKRKASLEPAESSQDTKKLRAVDLPPEPTGKTPSRNALAKD